MVDVIEHHGSGFGTLDGTLVTVVQEIAIDPMHPTEQKLTDAKKIAKERYYAIFFYDMLTGKDMVH